MKNIFWLQNATSLSLSVMEHYLWFIEAKNCKVKIFIFFSLKWTSCEVREGGQPERWNVYWNKVIREFRAEEHFVMSGQKVSILSPTFGRANGTDKHLFTRNPSIQRSRQRNYLGFFENRPEKENVTLVLSFIGSWSPKLQGVPKKCNIAIFSLNLFQRSDYTFSHVFQKSEFWARSILTL